MRQLFRRIKTKVMVDYLLQWMESQESTAEHCNPIDLFCMSVEGVEGL